MFVKERRYASKLLTVVLRDFPQFLTGGTKDLTKLKYLSEKVWTLSLQNLTYILPFYMERILYPGADSVSIDDQDIEFQGCIAQILSLMQTVAVLCQGQGAEFIVQNLDQTLVLLVAYCMMSQETVQLYSEDKNAFLTAFLNDSDDMMTSISIRNSVIELLQDYLF